MGLFFVLGSALCFSTMGTIVKDAFLQGGSAPGVMAVRVLGATVIWAVILRRRLFSIEWGSAAVRNLAIGGVAGLAIGSLAEFAAYRFLPVALVVVILFMAPVWVAVGQWAFANRPVGAAGLLGLALLGVGLVLLTEATAGELSVVGVLLALFASVGIAVMFTLGDDAIPVVGPILSAAVVAFASTVIVVPVAITNGTFFDSIGSAPILIRGLLLSLVATVVSMTLLFNGIQRLGGFAASVVSATEPVFAALLAWIFLGEVLSVPQMSGVLLVISGTVVVQGSRAQVRL